MRKIFRLIPIIFSLLLVGCKPYEPTSKKVPSAITKDNKIVMPFNTEVSLTAFNEKDFSAVSDYDDGVPCSKSPPSQSIGCIGLFQNRIICAGAVCCPQLLPD